jgi:hypothetical protein
MMRWIRLCVSLAAVHAIGCVTDDVDPVAGGTSGSGGAVASGGSGGGGGAPAGGTSGSGGGGNGGGLRDDPAYGVADACPALSQALLSDFTPPAAAGDAGAPDAGVGAVIPNAMFGDFYMAFSGGTYVYPGAGAYVVTSDISTGEWHISGNIGDYSGFGLYFSECNRIDASAYAGISFKIRGSVAMGNAVTLQVGTSEDDISHLWLNSQPTPPNPAVVANSGRCLPAMTQYDGSCATPTFSVPVTTSDATIEVRWAALTGGSPSASVNPAEITTIAWIFPNPPGAGTTAPTPYAADIYVDDLTFITE